ncbi:GATA transcription factor 5-like [Cynara cardunculus var. scolymus]|uniref:GATA transcription factor n=1 Tax=Cynara cardunculus var. scolymus TaxID=59895 RepID=A0A118JXN7_CYNCS|nr:GATA transcription factor 5-like [Cynara cardunculus var. scolymus]KVH96627.1 Transcription factor, GATA, plant [Cynara cardunculus var. scolymus]
MECIEARALKSSFLSEIGMKSTQQALFEDLFCVAGIDNVVNVSSSVEFSVDDLLDLSDKDFNNSGIEYSEEDEERDFSQDTGNNLMISSNFPSAGDLVSLPAGEIHLPVDDMESLEWLSQVVDDSTSDLSLLFPAATLTENYTGKFAVKTRHEPVVRPVIPSFTVLGLSYPVPRKYRTKRSKKTGRGWSSLTESSIGTSSSYDSTVTSSHFPDPVQLIESFFSFQKPATKKHKKNSGSGSSSDSSGSVTQRCCNHCQVEKTPQWRTGPLGPKTLCNACGVRFKSGRLFPEYRPACSPTFSDDIHSNSHRKVLEMRKKKETEVVEPEFSSGFHTFSS